MNAPIGGYFELDLGGPGETLPWLPDATRFQSARAAIAAVFLANNATGAWAPHFLCGVVRDALAHAGTPVRGYALDARRGVPDSVVLAEGEWLVCVDYFGLAGAAVDAAIARHGARRVLVDASQALLHAPRPGVATVYSPRKFCGLPDGGLLVNAPQVATPAPADDLASVERSKALLLRASGLVQQGHAQFRAGEASLSDCTPTAMSALTRRLLDAVDMARVRERRIANYTHLAEGLARAGRTVDPLPPGAVPLCCPLAWPGADRARTALAARGIFTPAYWPEAAVPDEDPTGMALRHGTLYLPCDQRYGAGDMARIVDTLQEIEDSA